ncbi:hypothetical protein GJ496_001125 [Pomphorhynchus laevis]|nr:hypothetical protein GJ496_001125 [Pomphorhynchus laevis]
MEAGTFDTGLAGETVINSAKIRRPNKFAFIMSCSLPPLNRLLDNAFTCVATEYLSTALEFEKDLDEMSAAIIQRSIPFILNSLGVNCVGELVCDCEHNTKGYNCEKCDDFYVDVPWLPGDKFNAHPCKECQCNNHSNICRFDLNVYIRGGNRSGGVCENCSHNTRGNNCNSCLAGFKQNHNVPHSHHLFCIPCNCHSLGSISSYCNEFTGQCICKPATMGRKCDRCHFGYRQSKNSSKPCIPG